MAKNHQGPTESGPLISDCDKNGQIRQQYSKHRHHFMLPISVTNPSVTEILGQRRRKLLSYLICAIQIRVLFRYKNKILTFECLY